jgi:hypothetical protein
MLADQAQGAKSVFDAEIVAIKLEAKLWEKCQLRVSWKKWRSSPAPAYRAGFGRLTINHVTSKK